jgi:hypothetical protein
MKRALLLLLVASPAFAYNEAVHAFITCKAVDCAPLAQPPTQADLDELRRRFWQRASAQPEFARRWPTFASFDSFEFKQFLMLDPAAKVHGFDLLQESAMTIGDASRWPDDDERNRHRYFRDEKTREVVHEPDGSPVPYDPATLDFGSLTGTTSQGHAHYALVHEPLSDDPGVLKREPWRFAVPPTAHAYGEEFIAIYSDLAALSPTPWLRATFEGAAFHHIEDMCNQIHTVQVGIIEFFESAWLQSKLHDVKTLGGLFGRRYSLKDVGLRLIANHHLLSEDLFARHIRYTPGEELGPILEKSSREAPEIYRLAWEYSAKALHDGIDGHEFTDKDDPDAYVDWSKTEAIEKFYRLEERGLRRAAAALRVFKPEAKDPTAMLLAYHARAAQRRAHYKPATGERLGIAWGYPVAAALLAAGAFAIASRLSKRW